MNKRIIILGAGESGVGSAVLAKKNGADVFVSDFGKINDKYKQKLNDYSIEWEEGKHTQEKILNADEIIKSPGIPEKVEIIQLAIQKGIPVISEIEYASRYCNAYKICITGSNGKTTTTTLLYYILKNAGLNVGIAGNVGQSWALQVAECNYDYYVIELSSFQLDGMYNFKADIAILMNITPDHLDRYNGMQDYTNSKMRIVQNQTPGEYFIYCADDEITRNEVEKRTIQSKKLPFSIRDKYTEGAFKENEQLVIIYNNNEFTMSILDLALKGQHNTYNSMAAGIASQVLKIRKEIIRESLSNFQGVEHRLEHVLKVHGIEFINDSKATNVNSTWYALESMPNDTIWIVGGVDKGNDYSSLEELVKKKVKAIICLGRDNAKIHNAFSHIVDTIVDTQSASEAVKTAYYLARKGDTVLLSPACASFDLFENYEDRGRKFKQAVKDL
ncbi:MAG: UDP-N-acetylmuramoylalanine--D-glutamate ligase [Bacteroidetes bacterium GWC2_33_15]|nr:MAG: UDP-N-acetylmuramoylalanine--D-glutamate ligase [Bacteroidetes bacterium GWA2_33_15]OFX51254.1 MAG: UDP-N-acetylmuramoylalanine--D-glutamate ligase [Bacteroidetes bacterium GWC2_33_15]OFX66364.1 MAG: UDP-N-acetylmuramoylalanine--D-glutamate ligase [Bacteroidetes bacterium GWB2_32_14]OFX70657.1 MAG: UDP-N-acetylmuramoylalanine--D-glutamate ligase [Bacteroidetes bacterium GWD2_33_33]